MNKDTRYFEYSGYYRNRKAEEWAIGHIQTIKVASNEVFDLQKTAFELNCGGMVEEMEKQGWLHVYVNTPSRVLYKIDFPDGCTNVYEFKEVTEEYAKREKRHILQNRKSLRIPKQKRNKGSRHGIVEPQPCQV